MIANIASIANIRFNITEKRIANFIIIYPMAKIPYEPYPRIPQVMNNALGVFGVNKQSILPKGTNLPAYDAPSYTQGIPLLYLKTPAVIPQGQAYDLRIIPDQKLVVTHHFNHPYDDILS